ncbi:MAG: hypothetical protein CW335_07865 [Clostridiales bacterium]|nr:hypothetical protein [Clostridiales bacterium]
MGYILTQYYTTKNPAYIENVVQSDYQTLDYGRRDSRYINFQKNGAQGLTLHSIGCAQPKAKPIADNFNKSTAQASVHAVLQSDGTVLQLCPWNYRMWHVGGSANNTHIGVEMCEPACIWYDANNGYKVHINDVPAATEYVRGTYRVAVELFADLCRQLKLDPLNDGVIISHSEAYKRGLGSNHGDPEHLWKALNLNYTMDTFRHAVDYYMRHGTHEEEEMRYNTLGDIKADKNNGKYYAPAIEKLLAKGLLTGKGGTGDETIIDLGEDAVRLLVVLARAGVFDKQDTPKVDIDYTKLGKAVAEEIFQRLSN